MEENKINTPWGPIGYLVYKRTYARKIDDKKQDLEEFTDTVERVIKACRTQLKCGFTEQEEERLREYLLTLKGTVAGRFLWQLGTKTVNKLGLASLQNCAFVTVDDPIKPFTWAMDLLMLGCGVGFNIQKENVYQLPKIQKKKPKIERLDNSNADFIVPDTREGWVKLLGKVLKSYFYSGEGFTYSTQLIRSQGATIKGFGGIASGPEILVEGIDHICGVLDKCRGNRLQPIDCLDIMCIIGMIVVAGNIRRSALLALGDCDDLDYLKAKRWDLGKLPKWRNNSNNSVVCNDINNLPQEFWDLYNGNSEPYGLINLDLSRSCGRLGETQYPDSLVQGFNPCQPGWAPLFTRNGITQLKDVNIGDEIWSETGWTKVINKWSTGVKDVYRYRTNAGIFYGTENHRILQRGQKIEVGSAEAIDRLSGYYDDTEIHYDPNIIMDGLVIGDGGCHKASNSLVGLYIGDDDMDYFDSEIKDLILYHRPGICDKFYEIITSVTAEELEKTFNRDIPDRFFYGDRKTVCSFLRGLYSANGTILTKSKRITFKTSSEKIRDKVQIMLSSIGISSYYTTNKPTNVKFSNGEYECKQSYDINISGDRKKFMNLIGFIQKYKNETFAIKPKTRSPKITFDIIDKTFISTEEVFDITVDNQTHTYWSAGQNVSNCAEQSLENMETCCLAEIFLPNIDSKEELFNVAKLLYRINKHSLSLPCHQKETEEVVHRNMRMGIGITGYLTATEEKRNWLSDVYTRLREFDKIYSKEHEFPESIKLTTVKPSGTLSLLAGVSSGGHPAYAPYYIRRVRIAADSPLIGVCIEHGYPIEYVKNFDGSEDYRTMVVEFPCKDPEHSVFSKDITAVQQLEIVKRLQTEWSDNSVSVTIYYRKNELDSIKDWLNKNYNVSLKSVSFLLHSDHGFDQAPLEEISKEEYERRMLASKPITSGNINESDISSDQIGCASGACPIK